MIDNKNKIIYEEQLKNCFFCLFLSIIFTLGLIYKTINNSITILNIKNLLFLVLPLLFLNTTIFILLKVFKNTITENNLFNNENKKLFNLLTYIIILFFISIILILNNDINRIHSIYCVFITSVNFLMSSYLLKKIFNYEMEKRK